MLIENEENLLECDHCGSLHESLEEVQNKELCDDCISCKTFECGNCNDLCFLPPSIRDGHGNEICSDCRSSYFVCGYCDEYYHDDEGFSTETHGYVCESCKDDSFFRCQSCDGRYDNDQNCDGYCDGCYEEEGESCCHCHNYGYKPVPIFKKLQNEKTDLFFGFELEVEKRDSDYTLDYIAGTLLDDVNENGFNSDIYLKEDGSLDNGFEIVSHPMTLGYIKDRQLFEKIGKINGKMKSFNTDTCGFHVHLSRKAFSPLHLFRFSMFLNEFQTLTLLVSQRLENTYWRFYNSLDPSISKLVLNKALINRYKVINFENEYTIEIRSFKGNLKPERLYKNIEFLLAVFNYTKNIGHEKMTIEGFLDFCFKDIKTYNNLIGFFGENRQKMINAFNYDPEKHFKPYQLNLITVKTTITDKQLVSFNDVA